MLHAALAGLAAGATWGVVARVWMRLVSTDPEFSWAGTLSIVGIAAAYGLLVGAAAERRRAGGRVWWLLLAVPGLLLFASPGMVLLPGCLVAAIALSRRTRWGTAVAVAALGGTAVLFWRGTRLNQDTMLMEPMRVQLALLVGLPLLGWWLSWHARDLFRSPAALGQPDQSDSPDLARSSLRKDSSLDAPAGPA
jgi:hypothetical protein